MKKFVVCAVLSVPWLGAHVVSASAVSLASGGSLLIPLTLAGFILAVWKTR